MEIALGGEGGGAVMVVGVKKGGVGGSGEGGEGGNNEEKERRGETIYPKGCMMSYKMAWGTLDL